VARPRDRRRTGFTSRAVFLAIAFCAVLLTLAVPLQQYLAQRGQLADLASQESAAKNRVTALEHAQSQWQDPAFIKQQARERLHFVKPGETAYVIIDPSQRSPAPVAPVPQQFAPPATGAWYGTLWSTVETAGRTTPKTTPSRTRQPTPQPIGPSPRAR
jgi:cell division protein FtsB